MYDIISIGVCLIDFTPIRDKSLRYPAFEQNPGGDPANMAAAAALLGAKTAFIGKVGKDQFGSFLIRVLEGCGVGTEGMVVSAESKTSLAFVHLFDDGQREFDFYRDADLKLSKDEIRWELLDAAKVLHVSALAFCSEISSETTLAVVKRAKENGALVSYDANWRPALWADQAQGKQMLKAGIEFADIIKVSEEELVYITEIESEEKAVQFLLNKGISMILVTKGAEGTSAYTRNVSADCPAFLENKPVDTTGAGDACFGSFVWEFIRGGKRIEALNAEDLYNFQRFANAVAGLSVSKRGGISSLPTLKEVNEFLGH